jgi:hypothetical protein
MGTILIAPALFYVEAANAACPTNFVDDGVGIPATLNGLQMSSM